MSIEPALTPEQWAMVRDEHLRVEQIVPILTVPADMPRIIAVANHQMLDDQLGKITRHHAWIVRTLADHVDTQHPGGIQFRREALELAGIIASYLPPETP